MALFAFTFFLLFVFVRFVAVLHLGFYTRFLSSLKFCNANFFLILKLWLKIFRRRWLSYG